MEENTSLMYLVDDCEELRLAIRHKISLYKNAPELDIVEFVHGDNLCGLIGAAKPEKWPDIILMDTQLLEQHLRGYEVCRQIREEYGDSIHIVGMSSDPYYREAWDDAGADQFVSKDRLPEFLKIGLNEYIKR